MRNHESARPGNKRTKKTSLPGSRTAQAPVKLIGCAHTISNNDRGKRISELDAHQIDLEMQNEELRRTRAELETSRNKYAELYDCSPVGYFTINARGLIREANLTGAEMLGVTKNLLVDKPFALFVERSDQAVYQAHRKEAFTLQNRQTCELMLKPRNAPPFYARLLSAAAENRDAGAGLIRTAVIDISERKKVEEEREKLISQLKAALAKINTLSGLLPICAWCKKVRNDNGYWEQVDKYLSEHTEVTFTHGMCDDCYEIAKKGLDKLKPKK